MNAASGLLVCDADSRERHLGVSYHTRAALSLCPGGSVARPAGHATQEMPWGL